MYKYVQIRNITSKLNNYFNFNSDIIRYSLIISIYNHNMLQNYWNKNGIGFLLNKKLWRINGYFKKWTVVTRIGYVIV